MPSRLLLALLLALAPAVQAQPVYEPPTSAEVNAGTSTTLRVWSAALVKQAVEQHGGGSASISDAAYNAGTWDGDTTTAPSKNAVRDKFEAMDAAKGNLSGGNSWTGVQVFPGSFTRTPSVITITANAGTIDITKGYSRATISAATTLTPSAAGADGQFFALDVINAGAADYAVTVSTASSFSFTAAASSTTSVLLRSDGTGWVLYGGAPTYKDFSSVTVATGDYVPVWDISAGLTGRTTVSDILALNDARTKTLTNTSIDANGTGNNVSNIETPDIAAATLVTAAEGIGSNNNDTTIPTSAAVKAYADSVGGATGVDALWNIFGAAKTRLAMVSVANGTTLTAFGTITSTAGTASESTAASDQMQMVNYATAATSGQWAGVDAGSLNDRVNTAKMDVSGTVRSMDSTNLRVFVGWSTNSLANMATSSTPSGSYFGVRYIAGTDTNWTLFVRDGTTISTADTGIAYSNDQVLLSVRYVAGVSVQAYINGSAAGSAITTNLPAVGQTGQAMASIGTTANEAKNLRFGQLIITNAW